LGADMKRTPLIRRTPLRASRTPKRAARMLAEISAAQRADMQLHRTLVLQQGCIVCYLEQHRYRHAEPHHLRHGMGAGMRNDDYHMIPLCADHHRLGDAFHRWPERWQKAHGSEVELLRAVYKRLRKECPL